MISFNTTTMVRSNRQNIGPNHASAPNVSFNQPVDTVFVSQKPASEGPKFGAWGTFFSVLPLINAGLQYERRRIDRSMERDEFRRKARERYEKIGRTYIERHRDYYREITKIKVVDGNGKVLGKKERVGPKRWYR
jgi:hypothetical protein